MLAHRLGLIPLKADAALFSNKARKHIALQQSCASAAAAALPLSYLLVGSIVMLQEEPVTSGMPVVSSSLAHAAIDLCLSQEILLTGQHARSASAALPAS